MQRGHAVLFLGWCVCVCVLFFNVHFHSETLLPQLLDFVIKLYLRPWKVVCLPK